MRNYEIMFIVSPNAPEEDIDKITGQVEGVITAGGGKVEYKWAGARNLGYCALSLSKWLSVVQNGLRCGHCLCPLCLSLNSDHFPMDLPGKMGLW